MNATFFTEMKQFLKVTDEDCTNMKAMGPTLIGSVDKITDAFYDHLLKQPATKKFLPDDATVTRLKATHKKWFSELFAGVYDDTYFANRSKIGVVHVRVGIHPEYVDGIMSQIEQDASEVLIKSFPADKASVYTKSLLKILDLDLTIINQAYEEERLNRLTEGTGLSRTLLETFINQGK
jgi:heme-based aerotactic transducer